MNIINYTLKMSEEMCHQCSERVHWIDFKFFLCYKLFSAELEKPIHVHTQVGSTGDKKN